MDYDLTSTAEQPAVPKAMRKMDLMLNRICLSRTWFFGLVMVSLAYTLLRGIRFPNLWSYTHYLFNYEPGFVRRGLIGELLRIIDIDYLYSYECFIFWAALILAVILVLLLRLIYRAFKPGDLYFVLVTLLFVTSLAMVYTAHSIGYTDQIGLLAALVVISIKPFRYRLPVAIVLTLFCLLIHEAYLVIFLPVVVVSLVVDLEPARHTLRIAGLAVFLLACLTITYSMSKFILPEAEIEEVYYELEETSNGHLRKGAFAILYQEGKDNIRITMHKWQGAELQEEFARSLLVTLPVMALITFMTILYLKQLGAPIYLWLMAIGASASPLVMNALGWDAARFNSLGVVTSFLVFLLFTSSHTESIQRLEKWHSAVIGVTLLGLLANLVATIPLFDYYAVKNFPFLEHLGYLYGVLFQGDPIYTIPSL